MKYFIDFEATQFDENIINIGCVCANGETFATLVKPYRIKNITKFITKLTGITQEMVENAPTADEAFNKLFDFIKQNHDNQLPKFYCYGDSDAQFIERTTHHMSHFNALTCALMIKGSLIDYSKEVQKYFQTDRAFGLRNVFCLVNSEEIEQHHDALEDAQMLQKIVENLKNNCSPEDIKTLNEMPSNNIAKKFFTNEDKIAVPRYWDTFKRGKCWKIETDGNEDNWVYKCVNSSNENNVMYFETEEMATLWFMRYFTINAKGGGKRKPSSIKSRHAVLEMIEKSIEENDKLCGAIWTKRKDVEENV